METQTNSHICLKYHRICNVVTIRTVHISEECMQFFTKNLKYKFLDITISVGLQTKIGMDFFQLGQKDLPTQIANFAFHSDRRAKEYMYNLKATLDQIMKEINGQLEEINEGTLEFV